MYSRRDVIQGSEIDLSAHHEANKAILQQLAAVHMLLGTERQATECDILVSTVMEALKSGAQTIDELERAVNAAWPGTEVQYTRLLAALQVAKEAGYVQDTFSGATQNWFLTRVGTMQADSGATWATNVLDCTESDLLQRARPDFPWLTKAECGLWIKILAEALLTGIHAASLGAVRALTVHTMVPRRYDLGTMHSVIERATPRPEVQAFLKAMVEAALDQTDTFGNELVSHVVTGYILHAVLSHRSDANTSIGSQSLNHVRCILDTPSLIPLIGANPRRAAMENGIRAAVKAGIEVVAPEHVIQELYLSVDVRTEEAKLIETSLDEGTNLQVLQGTLGDDIIRVWLDARQQGMYNNWSEFQIAAGQIAHRLKALGVVCRPHYNDFNRDRITECGTALRAVLRESKSSRSQERIERDVQTLAMARRSRRKRQRVGVMWPGAWVITTDNHMHRAYERLEPTDDMRLTLRPSELLTLLSVFAQPGDAENLAKFAGNLLTEELLLNVTAGYPVKVAVHLASMLEKAPEISIADVRIASTSVEALLDDQASGFENPEGQAARLAAAITAKRAERLAAIHESARERVSIEKEEMRARMEAAAQTATAEIEALTRAERRNIDVQDQLLKDKASSDAEVTRLRQDRERERVLYRRRLVFAGVISCLVVGTLLLYIGGGGHAALITLSPLILFLVLSWEWMSNVEVTWQRLLLSIFAEVITVADWVSRAMGWQ